MFRALDTGHIAQSIAELSVPVRLSSAAGPCSLGHRRIHHPTSRTSVAHELPHPDDRFRTWAVFPALALLLLGCARTVASSSGDAATDAPPEGNLELTVLVDLASPGTPGVGVPVRAVDETGGITDARTGADGVARMRLDGAHRYDVTAALAGHVATSFVALRVPARLTVRLPLQRPQASTDVRRRTLPIAIQGRSAARRAVVLEGASGSTVTPDDAVTLSVASWPGAPAQFWIAAYELDASNNFQRGGYLGMLSRTAPTSTTLTLSQMPREEALRVEFPFVGRATPATYGHSEPGAVLRFKVTEFGEGAAPVGRSTLRAPDATGDAIWTITRYDGPLAPELSFTTWNSRDDTLRGTVTLQPPFVGLVPAVSPVERLRTSAEASGVTFTADRGVWSRTYFEVSSADGTLLWRGFGMDDGSWLDRPLPVLPAEVPAETLLGREPLRARTCVLHDAPQMGVVPWSYTRVALPFWSRLSVCDAGVTFTRP